MFEPLVCDSARMGQPQPLKSGGRRHHPAPCYGNSGSAQLPQSVPTYTAPRRAHQSAVRCTNRKEVSDDTFVRSGIQPTNRLLSYALFFRVETKAYGVICRVGTTLDLLHATRFEKFENEQKKQKSLLKTDGNTCLHIRIARITFFGVKDVS